MTAPALVYWYDCGRPGTRQAGAYQQPAMTASLVEQHVIYYYRLPASDYTTHCACKGKRWSLLELNYLLYHTIAQRRMFLVAGWLLRVSACVD